MLKELFEKYNIQETDLEQMAVFMSQMGDMATASRQFAYSGDKIYLVEDDIANSDIIAQCLLRAERHGRNFEELKYLGIERCIEKITRRVEKGEI